jgi:hypothetical protein
MKGLVTGVSVRKGKGDNPPVVKIVFEGFLDVNDLTMVVAAFNDDRPLELGDRSLQVTGKMRLEAKGNTVTLNAEARKNLDKMMATAEAEPPDETEPDMGGEPAPKPRTALDDLAADLEM